MTNIIEKLENSTLKVIKTILIKMQFFLTIFLQLNALKAFNLIVRIGRHSLEL